MFQLESIRWQAAQDAQRSRTALAASAGSVATTAAAAYHVPSETHHEGGRSKVAAPQAANAYAVGARVEVWWEDEQAWFGAVVRDVSQKGYGVLYDDGEEEDSVAESLLRPLEHHDIEESSYGGDTFDVSAAAVSPKANGLSSPTASSSHRQAPPSVMSSAEYSEDFDASVALSIAASQRPSGPPSVRSVSYLQSPQHSHLDSPARSAASSILHSPAARSPHEEPKPQQLLQESVDFDEEVKDRSIGTHDQDGDIIEDPSDSENRKEKGDANDDIKRVDEDSEVPDEAENVDEEASIIEEEAPVNNSAEEYSDDDVDAAQSSAADGSSVLSGTSEAPNARQPIQPATSKSMVSSASAYAVGARVEVWWEDEQAWFGAVVRDASRKGYGVLYDDGEEEDGVAEKLLRLLAAPGEMSTAAQANEGGADENSAELARQLSEYGDPSRLDALEALQRRRRGATQLLQLKQREIRTRVALESLRIEEADVARLLRVAIDLDVDAEVEAGRQRLEAQAKRRAELERDRDVIATQLQQLEPSRKAATPFAAQSTAVVESKPDDDDDSYSDDDEYGSATFDKDDGAAAEDASVDSRLEIDRNTVSQEARSALIEEQSLEEDISVNRETESASIEEKSLLEDSSAINKEGGNRPKDEQSLEADAGMASVEIRSARKDGSQASLPVNGSDTSVAEEEPSIEEEEEVDSPGEELVNHDEAAVKYSEAQSKGGGEQEDSQRAYAATGASEVEVTEEHSEGLAQRSHEEVLSESDPYGSATFDEAASSLEASSIDSRHDSRHSKRTFPPAHRPLPLPENTPADDKTMALTPQHSHKKTHSSGSRSRSKARLEARKSGEERRALTLVEESRRVCTLTFAGELGRFPVVGLLAALADALDVGSEHFTVLALRAGSVLVDLSLPASAADTLWALAGDGSLGKALVNALGAEFELRAVDVQAKGSKPLQRHPLSATISHLARAPPDPAPPTDAVAPPTDAAASAEEAIIAQLAAGGDHLLGQELEDLMARVATRRAELEAARLRRVAEQRREVLRAEALRLENEIRQLQMPPEEGPVEQLGGELRPKTHTRVEEGDFKASAQVNAGVALGGAALNEWLETAPIEDYVSLEEGSSPDPNNTDADAFLSSSGAYDSDDQTKRRKGRAAMQASAEERRAAAVIVQAWARGRLGCRAVRQLRDQDRKRRLGRVGPHDVAEWETEKDDDKEEDCDKEEDSFESGPSKCGSEHDDGSLVLDLTAEAEAVKRLVKERERLGKLQKETAQTPGTPEQADGSKDREVQESAPNHKISEEVPLMATYEEGDRVEVFWDTEEAWFSGAVAAVRSGGKLYIKYDDGESEDEVSPDLLRRLEKSDDASADPQGGDGEKEVVDRTAEGEAPAADEDEGRRENTAVRLQCFQRQRCAVRVLEVRREERQVKQSDARITVATALQGVQRQRIARRVLEARREAAQAMQAKKDAEVEEEKLRCGEKAVVALQGHVRRKVALTRVQEVRDQVVKADAEAAVDVSQEIEEQEEEEVYSEDLGQIDASEKDLEADNLSWVSSGDMSSFEESAMVDSAETSATKLRGNSSNTRHHNVSDREVDNVASALFEQLVADFALHEGAAMPFLPLALRSCDHSKSEPAGITERDTPIRTNAQVEVVASAEEFKTVVTDEQSAVARNEELDGARDIIPEGALESPASSIYASEVAAASNCSDDAPQGSYLSAYKQTTLAPEVGDDDNEDAYDFGLPEPAPIASLPPLPSLPLHTPMEEAPREDMPELGVHVNVALHDGISSPVTSSVFIPPGCHFKDFVDRVALALGLPSAAQVGRIVHAGGGGAVTCGRSLHEFQGGESLTVAPVTVQAWDLTPIATAVHEDLLQRGTEALLADPTGAFVELASSDAAAVACEQAAAGAVDDVHAEMLAEAATIQHHAIFDAILESAESDLRKGEVDAVLGRRARASSQHQASSLPSQSGPAASLGVLSADLFLDHENIKASVEKDVANAIWGALVQEAALEIGSVLDR